MSFSILSGPLLCRPRPFLATSAGARCSRRHTFRPGGVSLEPRITPAGPVVITSAFVEQAGLPLATVNTDAAFAVQTNVTTRGLPAHARLWVSTTVNGLTQDAPLIAVGSAHATVRSWSGDSPEFDASPGLNPIIVQIHRRKSPNGSRGTASTSSFAFAASSHAVSGVSYSVAQIRAAYGINAIPRFGSARPDGAGQTIAIVDADNDPDIMQNLQGFDRSMHLSTNASPTLLQRYGPASSVLRVYNQQGQNITRHLADSGKSALGVPPSDPTGTWEKEETLDVEWAHAMAPGAKIDVVECADTTSISDRFAAVETAARLPNVSVVSMSWTFAESSAGIVNAAFEQAEDAHAFVTPKGHRGVTFVASAGDAGRPAGYPASSPNVVAVGGTNLTVTSGLYGGETGWSFPAPRTLKYATSSYSQTGTWTAQKGGYSGSYGVAPAGTENSAQWTTQIVQSDLGHLGAVEVSATWVPQATNATKVTYSIYSTPEPTGKPLFSATVDQARGPVGIRTGGSAFQYLGVYVPPVGSTLTVVVSADSAKGTIVADAIGVTPALATGGGVSRFEPEPSYQRTVQSAGFRTTPDVAFDASESTGVTVFRDGSLHFGAYGTSLSAPCWAGLIAIADQGRMATGRKPFDSTADPAQALQALYSLPATDFYGIVSGYNGFSAQKGYDEVTGLGSPIAPRLVPGLVAYGPRSNRKY